MSRNDMVKLMTMYYEESQRGGRSEMSNEERMSYILTNMEGAGIQPPRVSNKDFQALMHFYVEPNIYQWDEDLEKNKTFQKWKKEREERRKK